MTHPPQLDLLRFIHGPMLIVESMPLHPTQPEPLPPYPLWMHDHNAIHGKLPPPRPDNYSSDSYNEWENDQ